MANEIKTSADQALREFNTDGVPSSGQYQPIKANLRATFDIINTKVDALETTGATWNDPDLTGEAAIPLVAYVKGPILLSQLGITEGTGVNSTVRNANRLAIYNGAIAASASGRPLRFPRNGYVAADGDGGGIPITGNNVAIDLNGATLAHEGPNATTLMSVAGASNASRIKNFSIYNGVIDGKGQGKASGFYLLGVKLFDGCTIENLVLRDFFATGLILNDSYPTDPPFTAGLSSGLKIRNLSHERSSANIAAIATKPGMMQGDQCVLVSCPDPDIEGLKLYYSGRSGVSFGLLTGGRIATVIADLCASGVYVESFVAGLIENVWHRNHMFWDNSAASTMSTSSVWLGDADLTVSGAGWGSTQMATLRGVTMDGITRPPTGDVATYYGVRVSGRNGANHTRNLRIEDIKGRGVTGGLVGSSLVTFEGQITNTVASGVLSMASDIACRANLAYTAQGGSSANLMTDTWFEGVTCNATGYGLYAPGGDPNHVRSGIRFSSLGTSAANTLSAVVPSLNIVKCTGV